MRFSRSLVLLTFPFLLSIAHPAPGTAQDASHANRVATVSDPAGDAQPATRWADLLGKNYRSPDLTSVVASVDDRALTVEVRFAPGTFDANRTVAVIALDTDGDLTTGTRSGEWPAGEDYSIRLGGTAYYTATERMTFSRTGTLAARDTLGPYTVLADGYAVRIPLAAIGGDASRLRLYVISQIALAEDRYSYVLDSVPGTTTSGNEPKPNGWIEVRSSEEES